MPIRFLILSLLAEMTHPLLAGSSVVFVNGGLVASHVMMALASAGVEALRIIDTTEVTAHDIVGSTLLQTEDVGLPRAEALARRLHARVPYARCDAAQAKAHTATSLQSILDGARLAIACLDAPAPALLDTVNQAALAIDLPWIVAQTDGTVGYVGPTVLPHQTPCYRCVELRRSANRADLPSFAASAGDGPGQRDTRATPPLVASVGALAALEALRILTRIAPAQTVGRIQRIDFFAAEITSHRVLRFPHCPACGYGDTRPLLERWRQPDRDGR
jgi:ribosomal protein S12 methylthiotransferase accessory factor